jgi:hypothetical protein
MNCLELKRTAKTILVLGALMTFAGFIFPGCLWHWLRPGDIDEGITIRIVTCCGFFGLGIFLLGAAMFVSSMISPQLKAKIWAELKARAKTVMLLGALMAFAGFVFPGWLWCLLTPGDVEMITLAAASLCGIVGLFLLLFGVILLIREN